MFEELDLESITSIHNQLLASTAEKENTLLIYLLLEKKSDRTVDLREQHYLLQINSKQIVEWMDRCLLEASDTMEPLNVKIRHNYDKL